MKLIIIAVSTIICFAGCACDSKITQPKIEQVVTEVQKQEQVEQKLQHKPEVKPEMWTVGIGDIKRVGDDLLSSITIRSLGSNETSDFMFPAGTKIFPFFVVKGCDNIGLGISCGIFSIKGTYEIKCSKFFKDGYLDRRNHAMVSVWVEISMYDGEIYWEGNKENPQRFSIK